MSIQINIHAQLLLSRLQRFFSITAEKQQKGHFVIEYAFSSWEFSMTRSSRGGTDFWRGMLDQA